MPKIPRTQRTVQPTTARLTPPSTAGFGATGRARQELGNRVAQFQGVADVFQQAQDKNDQLDTASKALDFELNQNNKQNEAGRNITDDGRTIVPESLQRVDQDAAKVRETIAPKFRGRFDLGVKRLKLSIQGTAERQRQRHAVPFHQGKVIENSAKIITGIIKGEHADNKELLSNIITGQTLFERDVDARSDLSEKQKLELKQTFWNRAARAGMEASKNRRELRQMLEQFVQEEKSQAPANTEIKTERSTPKNVSDSKAFIINKMRTKRTRNGGRAFSDKVIKQREPAINLVLTRAKQAGLDPTVIGALVLQESGFRVSAKNPKSSARGPFQFINSTARKYGLKNDGTDSLEKHITAGLQLTKDNIAGFKKAVGRDPTPGEIYLAHFAGLSKAIAIGKAPSNSRASSIMGRAATNANPSLLRGKTVAQFRQSINNIMSGAGSVEVAASNPQAKVDVAAFEQRLNRKATKQELALAGKVGVNSASHIVNMMRLNPNAKVDDHLTEDARKNNPELLGKTAKDVLELASSKDSQNIALEGDAQGERHHSNPIVNAFFSGDNREHFDKLIKEEIDAEINNSFSRKTAFQRQSGVDALEEELQTDPNNPHLQDALMAAKANRKKFNSEIKNDRFRLADREGVIELEPLDLTNPKSVQKRIEQAEQIKSIYGLDDIQYLRPHEAEEMRRNFTEAPLDHKIASLAAIEQMFGERAADFTQEFAGDNKGLAHVGGLALSGRPDYAALALRGKEIADDKANKPFIENIDEKELNHTASVVYGGAFPFLREGNHHGFVPVAKNIAVALLVDGTVATPEEAYEKALRMAAGEREITDRRGQEFKLGGVMRYNDRQTLVPLHRSQEEVADTFDVLTDGSERNLERFLRLSGRLPLSPVTKQPIVADDLKNAEFVAIRNGKYAIITDDGMLGVSNDRGQETNLLGQNKFKPFVLDVDDLIEDVKKEAAELDKLGDQIGLLTGKDKIKLRTPQ